MVARVSFACECSLNKEERGQEVALTDVQSLGQFCPGQFRTSPGRELGTVVDSLRIFSEAISGWYFECVSVVLVSALWSPLHCCKCMLHMCGVQCSCIQGSAVQCSAVK